MARTIADDLYFPLLDRQNKLGGVSIRAEFAKAAMQGILANGEMFKKSMDLKTEEIFRLVAEESVLLADALIERLNQEE